MTTSGGNTAIHPSIALIGYRATGKSTIGRALASRLNWRFLDADVELERRAGRTIAVIFATDGEPAFRDLEEATLDDLAGRPKTVLATGGGALGRDANRQAIRRAGLVVWLRADAAELVRRLQADPGDRPALTSAGLFDEVASFLAAREPIYRQAADMTIDTGLAPPDAIADAIAQRWAAGANPP